MSSHMPDVRARLGEGFGLTPPSVTSLVCPRIRRCVVSCRVPGGLWTEAFQSSGLRLARGRCAPCGGSSVAGFVTLPLTTSPTLSDDRCNPQIDQHEGRERQPGAKGVEPVDRRR